MAAREDDTATVILTTTELKPPMIDWSAKDDDKELTAFKTLSEMW